MSRLPHLPQAKRSRAKREGNLPLAVCGPPSVLQGIALSLIVVRNDNK